LDIARSARNGTNHPNPFTSDFEHSVYQGLAASQSISRNRIHHPFSLRLVAVISGTAARLSPFQSRDFSAMRQRSSHGL
ncbi:MAG TPA: hypothetical protein VGZ26_00290, partial [Pirellulales bacterium]|nr:hypothetical protein [Pirellulales bacterium]